jgi:predicted nucleic acid-binding protein
MNDWLIVDANVIVKGFVTEDGSEQGMVWSSEAMLAAPAHALGEFGEVIRRKRMLNQITEEQWREIALNLPGAILPIALDDIFERAMEIMLKLAQSFYDCLYLAAAERWGCSLITADERLVSAAANTEWEPSIRSLADFGSIAAR